ncbi:MAG: sporulation protein [Actinobacteria bacterium]|nr:sporulation protein [Actinomycetota bacterium]
MQVDEILGRAGDNDVARMVFGEPIDRDGVTMVPVARIARGGGGGTDAREGRQDAGGGFGVIARPLGAYRIAGGKVTWVPAVDVTRIAIGGQVMFAVVMMLLFRSIRKGRRRS